MTDTGQTVPPSLDVEDAEDAEPDPVPDQVPDPGDVPLEEAQAAWAAAAREVLVETAGRYQQVIVSSALGAAVQERSGFTALQRVHQWIGPVLDLVAAECVRRGEPNLSALCVTPAGAVAKGYAATVVAAGDERPADPDVHAAQERLAWYRRVAARGLPADGGTAMLTPRLSASRTRLRKQAIEDRPVESCPDCFMVLSAQGTCLSCG